MRSRWTRWLPGFPAVLLMIAILGLWIGLCAVPHGGVRMYDPAKGQMGVWKEEWGFPLVFVGGTDEKLVCPYNWCAEYGFHTAPFLADLAMAMATAYIVAMGVERLVFRITRRRWPRWLPGFPAVLLIPAIVLGWPSLFWDANPWDGARGFPLVFGRYNSHLILEHEPARLVWAFTYLANLAIALSVGYIVAMAVDRLLFPALRASRRKRRGRGEGS